MVKDSTMLFEMIKMNEGNHYHIANDGLLLWMLLPVSAGGHYGACPAWRRPMWLFGKMGMPLWAVFLGPLKYNPTRCHHQPYP